jgi:hypothetical protein
MVGRVLELRDDSVPHTICREVAMPLPARSDLFHKQHTCVACGCVFRYAYSIHDWLTPMMSQTMQPKGSVRVHPCPDCGLYQPEMVMWLKAGHPLLMLLTFPAFLLMGVAATGNSGSSALLGQIGVGLLVLFALLHFIVFFYNPNANREANRARAEKEIAQRKLERVSPGTGASGRQPPAWYGLLYVPGLVALVAAPPLFILGMMRVSEQPAQPTNPHLQPSVVAPGQLASYTLTSCTAEGATGQLWRGVPTVRITNARALGAPEALPAAGSDQEWGDRLRVGRDSDNLRITPTIRFTLPSDRRLSGKTLHVSVKLTMTYPVLDTARQPASWDRTFVNKTSTVTESFEVKVADAGAVKAGGSATVLAVAGGAASLLGSIWLTGVAWALLFWGSKTEIVLWPRELAQPPSPDRPVSAPPPAALDDIDLSRWRPRPPR